MALSETARANHEKRFPNHVSVLGRTDPELVEIFGNFAFDQVLKNSRFDDPLRLLILLGSQIGNGAVTQFRIQAAAALNVGVSPIALKEVIYVSVPYIGMGRAVEFLGAANEVLTERGIELPLEGQSTTTAQNRVEKGAEIQKVLLGEQTYEQILAATPPEQMHIQSFLTAHCFGDHFTRGGLDLATRELVVFALLASMGGCEPQVRAHVIANANVGNDASTLVDVLTQILPFVGYARVLNALRELNAVAA